MILLFLVVALLLFSVNASDFPSIPIDNGENTPSEGFHSFLGLIKENYEPSNQTSEGNQSVDEEIPQTFQQISPAQKQDDILPYPVSEPAGLGQLAFNVPDIPPTNTDTGAETLAVTKARIWFLKQNFEPSKKASEESQIPQTSQKMSLKERIRLRKLELNKKASEESQPVDKEIPQTFQQIPAQMQDDILPHPISEPVNPEPIQDRSQPSLNATDFPLTPKDTEADTAHVTNARKRLPKERFEFLNSDDNVRKEFPKLRHKIFLKKQEVSNQPITKEHEIVVARDSEIEKPESIPDQGQSEVKEAGGGKENTREKIQKIILERDPIIDLASKNVESKFSRGEFSFKSKSIERLERDLSEKALLIANLNNSIAGLKEELSVKTKSVERLERELDEKNSLIKRIYESNRLTVADLNRVISIKQVEIIEMKEKIRFLTGDRVETIESMYFYKV